MTQRNISNAQAKLKNMQNEKKSLQEEALDLTDISRLLERQGNEINILKDCVENSIQPTIRRLLNFSNINELEKDIQTTAAKVIQCCK